MSLSNILSHTTLTTMVSASTSFPVSPVVASSSDTTASLTPTAQSNSSNSDQLIFILAASVAGLLVITILLLLVLILVFGFKCVRRCNSKRQVKKTAADASTNKPSMTSEHCIHSWLCMCVIGVYIISWDKKSVLLQHLSSYMAFPYNYMYSKYVEQFYRSLITMM